jgi:hypothetical protein
MASAQGYRSPLFEFDFGESLLSGKREKVGAGEGGGMTKILVTI